MKVIGKFVEESKSTFCLPRQGGYIVIDVDFANVCSYGITDACYVSIHSGEYNFEIKTKNGGYFSLDEANRFIKELSVKEVIDIDLYDMAVCGAFKNNRDYSITNSYDLEDNVIPLEVVVVNKED